MRAKFWHLSSGLRIPVSSFKFVSSLKSHVSILPFLLSGFSISAFVSVVLCAGGIWCFRKMEKTFADVI
jgi:ABC-type polysaccharide/polyol phosphate export permease